MTKLLTLVVALAATTAMLVTPAGAITGNFQDDFVHDYVGLLVFYTPHTPAGADPFSHRCSGSLISPTVVVTAGHCTEGVDEGRIYMQQSAAPNYDPNAFGGRGGDATTGYPYLNGITFHRADNYGFHNFAGFPNIKDVGVVVLDQPFVPAHGFAKLPSAGQVTDYVNATSKKSDVTFVSSGYGLTDKRPVTISFRARLMAMSYFVQDSSNNTDGFNLQTTANPSQDKGGTCNGDSGGPVLIGTSNTLASVTSFGMNAQCKGLDFSYRLDRPEVLAWITNPNRPDAG
jgi:trypsin